MRSSWVVAAALAGLVSPSCGLWSSGRNGHASKDEAVAILRSTSGEVRVRNPGQDWAPGEEGQSLAARETIRTGNGAKAVLDLGHEATSGQIKMGPSTLVRMRSNTLEVAEGEAHVALTAGGGMPIWAGGKRIDASVRSVVVLGSKVDMPAPNELLAATGEARERLRNQGMIEYTTALLDAWKDTEDGDLEWILAATRLLERANELARSNQPVDVETPCREAWKLMAEAQRNHAGRGSAEVDISTHGDETHIEHKDGPEISLTTDAGVIKLKPGEGLSVDAQGNTRKVNLPDAPLPNQPPDGWTVYNLAAEPGEVLSWMGSRATTYRLQVAAAPDFETLHLDQERITTSRWPVKDLKLGTWFWRVQAVDKEGFTSRWSKAYRFDVEEDRTPPDVILDKPVWK